MSRYGTRTRLRSLVRMPSGSPRRSNSTELLALWNSRAVSRLGRSLASAIIIPKMVETTASSTSGRTASSSRRFLTRGLPAGGGGSNGSAGSASASTGEGGMSG